jgi:hypothetical protein
VKPFVALRRTAGSARLIMSDDEPLYVDCETHGGSLAAVVCCHMLESDTPVGFVENSSDPDDLQAWCDACEAMFLSEGDKTEAFEEFNDRAIVCSDCYAEFKARHSKRRRKAK